MKFDLGSELIYTAAKDTTLILNIEAQHLRGQRITSGTFTITPHIRGEAHDVAETANRYRRLILPPGRFTIRYRGDGRDRAGDQAE